MRIRPLPLIAVSVVILLVVTTAVTMNRQRTSRPWRRAPDRPQRWLQLVTAVSAGTAGAVILSHQSRNVVAWLFLALGLAAGATELAISYAATCQSPEACNLELLILLDALWFPTLTIGRVDSSCCSPRQGSHWLAVLALVVPRGVGRSGRYHCHFP